MAWLSGYLYRKSITLSRASGAVTSYQMQLLVGEDVGATGENVDCNGHVQPDFDDLRFTTSDGTTLLPYWIESISGTTPNQLATVWIKFNSIETGATTFYMYYGKSDATAYSNGDNTFPFFDDFPGSSLDANKWTTVQGDVGVASGELVLTGTTGTRGIIRQNTANYPLVSLGAAIHTKVRCSDTTPLNFYWCGLRNADNSNYIHHYKGDATANQVISLNYNGTATSNVNALADISASHIYKSLWTSGLIEFFQDANNYRDHTTNIPTVDLGATFIEGTVATDIVYIDWVFIRNLVATEPVWGSWGTEETTLTENGWDYVGEHWSLDAALYFTGAKSAKCITVAEDEGIPRILYKDVSWAGVIIRCRMRTDTLPASTCQSGSHYHTASNGKGINPLFFGSVSGVGHFKHYDVVGGHQVFPNDKTYVVNTWYKLEVILDFTNSLQKTRIDGYDLGDITLKDVDGNTLNATHTLTRLEFAGSSNLGTIQVNIDDVEVYLYSDNSLLFWSGFEGGFSDTPLVVADLSHAQVLGAVVLTQVHNLSVANLAHANVIENVVLSQIHQLAVQALSHAHSLGGLTLTQVHQLVVQALNHDHALDGLALSQIHNLVVQDLAHAQSIENVTVILEFLLVVEDLIHAHSLGIVTLSQVHNLAIQALKHAHTLGNIFSLNEVYAPPTKQIPTAGEDFKYKSLQLGVPPSMPEGDFAYERSSLKIPDQGPEGSFAYQRFHLKKVTEEQS